MNRERWLWFEGSKISTHDEPDYCHPSRFVNRTFPSVHGNEVSMGLAVCPPSAERITLTLNVSDRHYISVPCSLRWDSIWAGHRRIPTAIFIYVELIALVKVIR